MLLKALLGPYPSVSLKLIFSVCYNMVEEKKFELEVKQL